MHGQYSVKMGEKYRVAFPSSYREKYGEKIIITYGFENSLIVTSEHNWNSILEKEIENKSFLQSKVRKLRRFFLGGISTIEFDNQGRFVVPEYLREYLHVKENDEVTFVWQREYIELWQRNMWEKYQRELLTTIGNVADRINGGEDNE